MDTTFEDKVTTIEADWLNAVNDCVYSALGGANTPLLGRTALDVPQETLEIVPQVRVNGQWVPLSTAVMALHADTHAFNGTDPLDHDTLLNAGGVKHVDHSALYIQAGSGLVGGGSLESTRSIALSYILEQALNCGNFQIQNLAPPTSANDASTKEYVDDHLTSDTSPLNVSAIPIDTTDLVSGDVWSNNGVLTIVP